VDNINTMSIKDDIPAVFYDKLSPKGIETIQKCKDFVDDWCLPADELYMKQISSDPTKRWKSTPEVTEKLKAKAKQLGLYNMFLSKHYKQSPGFTNLEYGLMAQYLGQSFCAPEVTNTNAPDTGNMEILAKYGSPYHLKTYFGPLFNGDMRSAFLMTEKGTSSSNALNISCTATLNSQGQYVINGVKWFASGAGDPRCAVWLVMCKTGDNKDRPYENHSLLVLDAKAAIASGKASVVRPLSVIGYDDAPHGHMEVSFNNYVVSKQEMPHVLLAGVGKGFEIIQSRLGPGRIHHCMRLIGVGQFALKRTAHRASHRDIFGKPLADRESFLNSYASHKIAIERCRLLVLNAAHKIDISNAKQAQKEIAMAKIETPRTIVAIVDWCMQMFGAEGLSQDTELARMWAHSRVIRIADGPDEAHLGQLGRHERKSFKAIDDYFERFAHRQVSVTRL
jgi:acyl-CoA dehydrogenase